MKNILITIVLAAIVSFGIVHFSAKPGADSVAATEDAYARIMRTKTLRCAHYVWPPFADRDINTGKMEGIYPDLTNALAERYGFKVEWTLELVPGNEVEQMKSGAADLICGGGPFNAALANQLFFSQPVYYDPASVFVRADNAKIQMPADLNKPEVIFTAVDGDLSYDLAKMMFPNATVKALPGIGGPAQMIEDLRTGKAHAAVLENVVMQKIGGAEAANFRKVNLGNGTYVGMYVNSFGVLPGETRLLQALDQMTEDMRNIGLEEKVLAPWMAKYPGDFIPVRDYRTLQSGMQ